MPLISYSFAFPDDAPYELHVHIGGDTERILAAIGALSSTTMQLGALMAIDLTSLTAAVEHATTVDESARVLIEQIAQQVRDLAASLANEGEVSAALNDLAGQLESGASGLSDAVVANTPAAP